MTIKKKDDELLVWAIVAGIFLLTLAAIDIWYASWGAMSEWFKWGIIVLQCFDVYLGIGSLYNWADPNFDKLRKIVCGLSIACILLVGIHHAIQVENNQVIIDSKENTK